MRESIKSCVVSALEPDAKVDKCAVVRVRCDFSRVTHVRAARLLARISMLIDPITELLDLHVDVSLRRGVQSVVKVSVMREALS